MANNSYMLINDEYETKRRKAIRIAESKKDKIYEEIPELYEYENMIKKNAIETSRKIMDMSEDEVAKQKIILEQEISLLREKINNILKKHGYSTDDFEPKFECNICEDKGYIIENDTKIMCSCYKKRVVKEKLKLSNLSNIEEQTFDTFVNEYYSKEIVPGKPITYRENAINVKRKSMDFVRRFDSSSEKSILFTGKTGLGKTFLSNCIANELIKNNYTVLYQTSSVLMDKILDYKFKNNTSPEIINFVNEVYNADLLIIDDLGTETINNYRSEELFEIINNRIKEGKKILISTNLSLKELKEKYGERITSRIIGEFNCYGFYGDDIRILKKQIMK